ncbi:PaaI family thioesterase [bacterium]|nr:PaaI family thioesterase [bacterium]
MEPQRLDEIRSLVETFIVGAPYARRLGVCLEELVERDRVRVRLPYVEDNTTIADMVHGGAIASLVDVAATAACWASPRVEPGARGTTIGFSINFLAAGRGQDLVATAAVIQRGASIAVCDVAVHGIDGTLAARATVTYKVASAPAR